MTPAAANTPPHIHAPNRVLDHALEVATAVQSGDPMATAAALATVRAPEAMVLALAALVDLDAPVHRWWREQRVDSNPCRRCGEPLGLRSARSQSPYHEDCRIEARRETWRNRQRRLRAGQHEEATA